MKIRYKVSLLLIGLMLVGCMFITHSYALWIMTEEQTNENNVEVGCFSIGYEEQTESINLSNTYPVDDTTGLNSNPYTFTITNTCTINNNYVVTLNTLSTNTLNVSNIKYAIYKSTENKPTVGSKLSRVNNDLESLSIENLGTSYILDTGILTGGEKEEGIVNGGETVTYNLYLWIDNEATNDVEGQKFEASINIITAATESANSGELFANEIVKCGQEGTSAVDCITNNAYLDTTNLAYDGTADNNLRYIGANPNNYVTFNGDEKWRIMGIIDDKLKIIRSEIVGGIAWSNNGDNTWETSTVKTWLNETYVINSDLVVEGNWNVGKAKFEPPSSAYVTEQQEKWTGRVGLMTASDYGYGVGGSERRSCLERTVYNYNKGKCKEDDWIFSLDAVDYPWTMTGFTATSNVAIRLDLDGGLNDYNVTELGDIIPVVYLNAATRITSGNGTSDSPFTLEL